MAVSFAVHISGLLATASAVDQHLFVMLDARVPYNVVLVP